MNYLNTAVAVSIVLNFAIYATLITMQLWAPLAVYATLHLITILPHLYFSKKVWNV